MLNKQINYDKDSAFALLNGEGFSVVFVSNMMDSYADVFIGVGENTEAAFAAFDAVRGGELPITGNGSISGLMAAKDYMLSSEFIDWVKSVGGKAIRVMGADNKRVRAYRRLTRYGFKQQEDMFTLAISQ